MSQDNTVNPYDAPDADLGSGLNSDDHQNGRQFCPPQKLKASAGFEFLSEAWEIYKKAPVKWVFLNLLVWIISAALTAIPVIGILFYLTLTMPLMAGLYIAARDVEAGRRLTFGHAFSAFSHSLGRLVILSVTYLLALLASVFLPFLILAATGPDLSLLLEGDPQYLTTSNAVALTLTIIVSVTLCFIVLAMVWFSPMLIMEQKRGVLESMKLSLKGCFRNILPMLLLSLGLLFWTFLAMIPLFLGLFILMPVTYITVYTAYRRIFTCV